LSSRASNVPSLPDITTEKNTQLGGKIDQVGMAGIAIPLTITDRKGKLLASQATADITVSLDDADAKGIHMSRLYNLLQIHLSNQTLTADALKPLMLALIESQAGLSSEAILTLHTQLTLLRPALISKASGYQSYDITITAHQQKEHLNLTLALSVPYSSTCPCSASLSRKALADAFTQKFSNQDIDAETVSTWLASKEGSIATAHAQRSFADVTLTLRDPELPDYTDIIDLIENTLGTPLQTAVKREDEQAFAKRNAENLMFVEDAVRRLHNAFSTYYQATYFHVKVEHQESLHAHDAIAQSSGAITQR